MIRASQIPDEAVEAAAKIYYEAMEEAYKAWRDEDKEPHPDPMSKALAAALNAWPGAVTNYSWDASHGRLILPLPQEESDE